MTTRLAQTPAVGAELEDEELDPRIARKEGVKLVDANVLLYTVNEDAPDPRWIRGR